MADFQVRAGEATIYVLIATWFLAGSVIVRSYSGALTSQLSVRYMPADIKDLEDLAQHPSVKIALETQTAFSDYLKVTAMRYIVIKTFCHKPS